MMSLFPGLTQWPLNRKSLGLDVMVANTGQSSAPSVRIPTVSEETKAQGGSLFMARPTKTSILPLADPRRLEKQTNKNVMMAQKKKK